jgi:hypothetical protein
VKKYEDKFGNKWNKKNLRKWIDACRDTKKYPQAKSALARVIEVGSKEVTGYCCLGVASKISRCGKFVASNTGPIFTFKDKSSKSEYTATSFLSAAVQRWLGANGSDPRIDFGAGEGWYTPNEAWTGDSVHCSALNDGWQLSLPQIGDMLEYFVYNNIPDAE